MTCGEILFQIFKDIGGFNKGDNYIVIQRGDNIFRIFLTTIIWTRIILVNYDHIPVENYRRKILMYPKGSFREDENSRFFDRLTSKKELPISTRSLLRLVLLAGDYSIFGIINLIQNKNKVINEVS